MKKQEKYTYKRTSCYDIWTNEQIKKANIFSNQYMKFLDIARTERLCITEWIKLLESKWFKNIEKNKWKLKAGDKIYFNFRNKNLFATILWKQSLDNGIRLIATHIDSPRIDLKYMPMYESDWLCLLKTHYYGWIKKYQWVTIPLSIHWVIYDKNNKKIEISIWDNPNDPVFFLSDILPHLGREQLKKEWSKIIEWEQMNLIIWSKYSPNKKEKIKINILKILFDQYWITEKSFISAELQLTPHQQTKEIWFDKSMIWGYGHDDRSCSYCALRSLADTNKTPFFTNIVYWSDKEEIGSRGTTSADSNVLRYFLQLLAEKSWKDINLYQMDKCLFESKAISGDVSSLIDPSFKSVYDPLNTAIINHWLVIEKYTWAWWKYSANDADAEYIQEIINHFDKNKVTYQMWWLGKVDEWWGWTISQFFAKQWIKIIDIWIWVLNMHSPFEIISKTDLFTCYQAYWSFWNLSN